MHQIDRRQSQLQLESTRQSYSPPKPAPERAVHAGLVHHPPHKKKPPLPSPFLQKYESTGGGVSHSKLTLYSQAQVQQA